MTPVYRWVMGETRLFGLHLWFRLHMALQLSGMVCFIVGFAYAWLYLPGPGNGNPTGGNVGLAHMYLGTIVMGLACLQVIIGFIRPKPDARVRPHWNMLHHWLGRLTMASAWATLYMGIWMAHTSLTYKANLVVWLVPVAAAMGLILLVDICLTITNLAFDNGSLPTSASRNLPQCGDPLSSLTRELQLSSGPGKSQSVHVLDRFDPAAGAEDLVAYKV